MTNFAEQNIFDVNAELESEIFSSMPSNYSHLEQALFIYNELCKKLNYSLDFYFDEGTYVHKFTDPMKIKNVDGKTNKDVVCFTFDRIFIKMLYDRGLIDYQQFWRCANYSIDYNYITPEHNILELWIDDVCYYVDATMGVYKRSDLSQAKFSDYRISGWRLSYPTEKDKMALSQSIEKVMNDSHVLQDAVYDYAKEKYKSGEYKHYSIDLRMSIFAKLIFEYGNKKDFRILSYIDKLKKLIFFPEEYDCDITNKTKVAIKFMGNKNPDISCSVFVFYNVGEEVKSYQIDIQENDISLRSRKIHEIKEDVRKGYLKYATYSKSIDQIIEPVFKAAQNCSKVML